MLFPSPVDTRQHPPPDGTLLTDLRYSFAQWPRWLYMAGMDIETRYKRSVIGPFWIMLTNAFMLTAIGFTYSYLWQGDFADFMPYFGVSYLLWTMLSTLIGEATDVYTESASIIQNYAGHKLFWVLRTVCRNFLIMLHMAPIYLVLAYAYPIFHAEYFLAFFLALPLFLAHCIWITAIIAVLATRFRDVKRLVPLLIMVVFLVTPILWKASTLKKHTWLYELNPVYYIMELTRAPLLGYPIMPEIWSGNLAIVAFGSLLALFLHRQAVRRLFYWL